MQLLLWQILLLEVLQHDETWQLCQNLGTVSGWQLVCGAWHLFHLWGKALDIILDESKKQKSLPLIKKNEFKLKVLLSFN